MVETKIVHTNHHVSVCCGGLNKITFNSTNNSHYFVGLSMLFVFCSCFSFSLALRWRSVRELCKREELSMKSRCSCQAESLEIHSVRVSPPSSISITLHNKVKSTSPQPHHTRLESFSWDTRGKVRVKNKIDETSSFSVAFLFKLLINSSIQLTMNTALFEDD